MDFAGACGLPRTDFACIWLSLGVLSPTAASAHIGLPLDYKAKSLTDT
jgi:hypothetical protein